VLKGPERGPMALPISPSVQACPDGGKGRNQMTPTSWGLNLVLRCKWALSTRPKPNIRVIIEVPP